MIELRRDVETFLQEFIKQRTKQGDMSISPRARQHANRADHGHPTDCANARPALSSTIATDAPSSKASDNVSDSPAPSRLAWIRGSIGCDSAVSTIQAGGWSDRT